MTIGDVLAAVSGIVSICLANWALLVGVALLFGRRTTLARQCLEESPLRALGVGALLAATAGVIAVILVSQPNGLLKLVGWGLLLGLLALSVLGAGGLARLLARRIQGMDASLSALGALGRGTGLLIVAGLVPLLGWFLIIPLTLIISLGAGCQVLRSRTQMGLPQTPPGTMPGATPGTAPPSVSAGTLPGSPQVVLPSVASSYSAPPPSQPQNCVETAP